METKKEEMKKKIIYLDYAAATPTDKKVQKAMAPFYSREFANPSSLHQLGQHSRAAVETAREQVASFLSCSADEVVFTSGATEANNIVIQGISFHPNPTANPTSHPGGAKLRTPGVRSAGSKPHIITSMIEHESVLAPVLQLEREGVIEVTYIAVSKEGIVHPDDIEKALGENTALVSIQYANSETGTIQPIAKIGKVIKKYKEENIGSKILFHTDAVQAALYLHCNVAKLGVDLLTLSGHKIYGPKGVGVLYIKKGSRVRPLFFGGGQEQDVRPGTENVACIVGMGEAIAEIRNPKHEIQNIQVRQLRDRLIKIIPQRISGVEVTGSIVERLPNNVHLLINGVEGKDVVFLLDQKGVAVSTGSACSERSKEPSHVLLNMGYGDKEARSAVRITLGKHTKKEEVEKTVKILEKVVEQLRAKK
ncbi:MAG: cysteine desulfurase family protein [bacterium]|nr:cysteine desulfurase family protein [bacterium]